MAGRTNDRPSRCPLATTSAASRERSGRWSHHRLAVAAHGIIGRGHPNEEDDAPVPPINELSRIEPVYLARLDRQGIFTTGLLLEVSETPTRRQYLADQVGASPNDVLTWRDEALMLNLAGFGPGEHQLLVQAGIDGVRDILHLPLEEFGRRLRQAATELNVEPPDALRIEGWWEQAKTLEEE